MDPDKLMDMEFAFVSWEDSCHDPFITADGDFRECRRTAHHRDKKHCSGFGVDRIWWT